MKSLKEIIQEKLRVSKQGAMISLSDFKNDRTSLKDRYNDTELNSHTKVAFINWAEKMLVEDGVVNEFPGDGYMLKHILRFDGDILFDNIVDTEIEPVVSTEQYQTYGEAYMNVVTFYVKNKIFDNCNIINEKLKVSINSNDNICDVILGRLVAYMLGYADKSIEQIRPENLSASEAGFVITSVKRYFNGSYRKLYDFLVDHKDDIVELECSKTHDWWTYTFEVDGKEFIDKGWEDSLIGLQNNKKHPWSKYIDFIV